MKSSSELSLKELRVIGVIPIIKSFSSVTKIDLEICSQDIYHQKLATIPLVNDTIT